MAQPLPKHRSREYETILIVNPDAGDTIDQVAGRMTDVIARLDGKLLRAENWGKRKLAYPVAKSQKGIYLYLRYLGYSDLVHEMERNLRMLEPVIKYLTVKLDEDIDPDARPVREEDISFLPQFDAEEQDHSDKRSTPSSSMAPSGESLDPSRASDYDDDEDEDDVDVDSDDDDVDEEDSSADIEEDDESAPSQSAEVAQASETEDAEQSEKTEE